MSYQSVIKKKSILKKVLLLIFVIIIIGFSIWEFSMKITSDRVRASDEKLVDLSNSNINSANTFFNNQILILKSIAVSLENYDDLTESDSFKFLRDIAKELKLDLLGIDTFDGQTYTSKGKIFYVANQQHLNEIKNGKIFISNVEISASSGKKVITIFVPIHDEIGVPRASLRCEFDTEKLHEYFGINFSDYKGYFHIVDEKGEYVANSETEIALLMDRNFFEAISMLNFTGESSAQKMQENFKSKKEGYASYSYEGNIRDAYYTPLGINNWTLISITSTDWVNQLIQSDIMAVVLFLAKILFVLLILFVSIYIEQRKSRTTAILDEQCFRVLSEQTGNIIFEWDFTKDEIKSMSNFERIFGRQAITTHNQFQAINSNVIHPDDIKVFSSIFTTIKEGKNVTDAKFRIKDIDGNFVWCSLSGVVINDLKGKLYKAIGSMKNIDVEEKEKKKLKDKAEKDLLTDIYNKISTEILITEYLEDNKRKRIKCALFIIDLDNFKTINDNLGHQFGDNVLVEAANKLKKIFRASDIIGRIGGDEFLVFLKDITNISIINERAISINEEFEKIINKDICGYKISTSIGISVYPDSATSFVELYRNSDKALYKTKDNGKNNFTIYSNKMDEMKDKIRAFDDAKKFISSYYTNDYIHSIFEMLYETKDISATINVILANLGQKYGVDRCYIFEITENRSEFKNTYEWCAEGTQPQIENLQNIPLQEMEEYFSNFNDDGIFACSDIDTLDDYSYSVIKPQGIKSMLHSGIYDKGKIKGMIGFDDCVSKRTWSGEEIASLGYISRVISIFIVKKQISKELLKTHQNYIEMLDNMMGYVYVVNPESHKMLYVNKPTEDYGARVGQKCYKFAFNKNEPCEDCPIKNLNESMAYFSTRIYSEKTKNFVNVTASKLIWDGNCDAVLICCLNSGDGYIEKNKKD